MTIDVSELIRKKIIKKDLHLTFDSEDILKDSEDVKISSPIKLQGTLSNLKEVLSLDGNLTCEVKLLCSRCLEDFTYPLDIEIHEKLSSNQEVEDDEISFFEGDSIDISNIIENNIVMALPVKKLCRQDCKGLCQNCGVNLNNSSCKCDDINIDPRLAKLKDLFSSD